MEKTASYSEWHEVSVIKHFDTESRLEILTEWFVRTKSVKCPPYHPSNNAAADNSLKSFKVRIN